jgi:hypothetical protein
MIPTPDGDMAMGHRLSEAEADPMVIALPEKPYGH